MDSPHIPNEGQLLAGPLFNEPMLVETVRPGCAAVWTVGLVGSGTRRFRGVQLSENGLGLFRIVETSRSFDGDPQLLKPAIQAYALGIGYEFDPYFGLSISRVDPLPHQLEAVYDYLLKVPRARFLLADDAEAGPELAAGRIERVARGAEQSDLFSLAALVDAAVPETGPKGGRQKPGVADEASKTRREATTLGRVHAAMLLQAGPC
jgi:hypothetical protein